MLVNTMSGTPRLATLPTEPDNKQALIVQHLGDALKLYTIIGAYASFEENIKGSIEVWRLANLVILEADLTNIDPFAIEDIRVERTILGEVTVFQALLPELSSPTERCEMKEVVLLGDSIFDNANYVDGGPDVAQQVRERLPEDWKASLLAIDGSVTAEVHGQLQRLPKDASHLIISTGGNDAVNNFDLLSQSATSVSQVLATLWEVGLRFRETYHQLLASAVSYHLPMAVCTIYYPAFEDPALQRAASAGLTFFNDAILLEAIENRIPVLDLRLIFTEPEDYANPIEPSVQGGAKLADAICRIVMEPDSGMAYARVHF